MWKQLYKNIKTVSNEGQITHFSLGTMSSSPDSPVVPSVPDVTESTLSKILLFICWTAMENVLLKKFGFYYTPFYFQVSFCCNR